MDSMQSSPRTIDIALGGQEVITIDLDALDTVDEVLELLSEPTCQALEWVWTVVATEFWRRGSLESAEKVALAAEKFYKPLGRDQYMGPIWSLLANIKIAQASVAPKMILPEARHDVMKGQATKDELYQQAAGYSNSTLQLGFVQPLAFLTRGIQQLATRKLDEAMSSFNDVLQQQPTNLIALTGKGRILYAQRNYNEALKLFRRVLELNPRCSPDPRIGIGLCFWSLGHKDRARAAWQRSLDLNPKEWPADLLLGLDSINASKNEATPDGERAQLFTTGTKSVERAFKRNNKSAAAANALCEIFLRKGAYDRALKLAERAIQFADTITVLTEGYIRAARVCHAEGSRAYALKFFEAALQGQPKQVIAAVGLAQIHIQNDEMAAALHALDRLLQSSNVQISLEATAMLASLRAFPRPGVSSSDAAKERVKARELFERVIKTIDADEAKANTHGLSRTSRNIVNDVDLHVEIARLWQEENLDRTARALREAMRISESVGKPDPRILNNLGALQHLDGHLKPARELYENALTTAAGMHSETKEAISTSILYNLARVYEDEGTEDKAKDAYEKLLLRHPEYVDAKLRQAQMLASLNRHNDAHELIKQALAAQGSNLNVRAFYTCFLMQANLHKVAKEFVFATLKDVDKHDVYSLCAAGWILYHQSRESRETSQKATDERRRNFQRATEFFEKALHLDPMCAFAAQGLAIVTAEDALGTLSGVSSALSGSDEAQRRLKNSRDALDIFTKARESINDGSVHVNIGHCHYARDEFDRAIESYETASTRFYGGHNVPVLLCLCRSWYAKATKDVSFASMNTALSYVQRALHIQPNDKAVLYNIAMIQQKSAEMLFGLPTNKRTLRDLTRAIEHANNAQKLFASLAADKSDVVPYSRDLADQRRKYGDNLLRKSEEHLSAQRQYESEVQAKLDSARQRRQEEKDRLNAIERERSEAQRREAEKLAEERKVAREQAQEWTREIRVDSDEERERRPKKSRKQKAEGSGDEGEPKKKRRGKLMRRPGDGEDAGLAADEQLASEHDDEDGDRPKKRLSKKRAIRDEDEEEIVRPQKKQFKSKATVSDTDDEDVEMS